MNGPESKSFLRGEMNFTPQRMMRYIRSRARLSTDEDIEDILQTALILVTKHFDPSHADANLSLYCLGACNKAIAQNLERYHKVVLRKRTDKVIEQLPLAQAIGSAEVVFEGKAVQASRYAPAQAFTEQSVNGSQWRTQSLDSMFDPEDGRQAEDLFGWEYSFLSGDRQGEDPAKKALLNDLINQILAILPEQIHRTCFLLKYVEGYKREDLISCLKMDPKSIDTVDKRIVRALKAFKEKLDESES
jgi:DNA-directed RNA polymerase specialized sigma24 family protein